MTSARHLNESVEHYTPAKIVEAARHVLGYIELDPASSMTANETVRARQIFTREDDGLSQVWAARTVYCNPPGSKIGNEGQQSIWWHRLAHAWQCGDVQAAIFCCFSVELLQTAQSKPGLHPLDFPICFPSSRVAYMRATEDVVARQRGMFDVDAQAPRVVPGDQPPHASAIVYLPAPSMVAPIVDVLAARRGHPRDSAMHNAPSLRRFREAFEPMGKCAWAREVWG